MQQDPHDYNSLRILSQTAKGYIGQCNCCDHYNFVFGNLVFIFTADGLTNFQAMLYGQTHLKLLESPLLNQKRYILPSPIPNFMLSFDEEEIEEIKNLFQETLLTLEIDRIFAQKN